MKPQIYDASAYLGDDETIAEYLTDAFESGDLAQITLALGNIGKARGISALAKDAGLSREDLYCAFSADGNPSLSTLVKVIGSLGFQLEVKPKASRETGTDAAA
jgi:probable addiction module antidote protein